jgi:hypothetical protein
MEVSSAVLDNRDSRVSSAAALLFPITLRCYAYRHAGAWIAECVDLDLMVKSRTPEGAAEGLRDAMTGYLKTVVAGGNLDGLVPRPSPLSHRMRYHWFCLKAAGLPRGHRDFRLLDCSPSQLPVCA